MFTFLGSKVIEVVAQQFNQALVIADIPNIDPEDDNLINPTSWRDYVIPVQYLENRLENEPFNDYNFLSNIPTEIQEIIENRPRAEILDWINSVSPTAPLMAVGETPILSSSIPTSSTIASDTSVGHDGFTKGSSLASINTKITSTTQIGVAEVGIVERSFSQDSIPQFGMTEVSLSEVGLTKHSSAQISPLQISSFQSSFTKTHSPQVGMAQVGITEISPIQISVTEIGFPENNLAEFLIHQMDSWQLHSSKIPFSSSIPSQQLPSIHNSTPTSVNSYRIHLGSRMTS